MRHHQHYHLVLGVIGCDLTTFNSTYEFVNAMRDALLGGSDAIFLHTR
jgi:hypothetical protein